MQDIELGTDEMGLRDSWVNENINQGSNNQELLNQELLSLLVNDRLLQPLCKHPFVTAFLELHYSFITNIQAYLCLFRLIYFFGCTVSSDGSRSKIFGTSFRSVLFFKSGTSSVPVPHI